VRPKYFLSLWYVGHEPCTYLMSRLALSPNGPKRAPIEPHGLVVPSGVSKMIFESMLRFVQTMHLSCTNTNTVSKQTQKRFRMTHVT
jgi:hypothetical protein